MAETDRKSGRMGLVTGEVSHGNVQPETGFFRVSQRRSCKIFMDLVVFKGHCSMCVGPR